MRVVEATDVFQIPVFGLFLGENVGHLCLGLFLSQVVDVFVHEADTHVRMKLEADQVDEAEPCVFTLSLSHAICRCSYFLFIPLSDFYHVLYTVRHF